VERAVNTNKEERVTTKQIEANPLTAAVKRLAITKDQRRVLLALADAGDWTPMHALDALLGKTRVATNRMVEAVLELIDERLVEGGEQDGVSFVRALPVEHWEKDLHFMLGIAVCWEGER
jgi:hypothetical protein